jgi:hypothetical protein
LTGRVLAIFSTLTYFGQISYPGRSNTQQNVSPFCVPLRIILSRLTLGFTHGNYFSCISATNGVFSTSDHAYSEEYGRRRMTQESL